MSEEEFFAACLVTFGDPAEYANPFEYVRPNARTKWDRGFMLWTKDTRTGQNWMLLVTHYGEAKSRAPKLYSAYKRWLKGHRNGNRPTKSGGD